MGVISRQNALYIHSIEPFQRHFKKGQLYTIQCSVRRNRLCFAFGIKTQKPELGGSSGRLHRGFHRGNGFSPVTPGVKK